MFLVDRPGAVQSTVRLGLPVVPPTSPDYIPLVVTNALLGGSFGSRITANIREKHGYTYSPNSVLALHPGAAPGSQAADVTTKDTAAALREVVAEVERLRKRASRRGRADRHPEVRGRNVRAPQQQPRRHRRPSCASSTSTGSRRTGSAPTCQRVEAVTPADVTRVTRKYLDPVAG